jgi:Protein of unknown function (DUF3102)
VLDAAKTAAERAIEAGRALIEAKALVKHGEWLPWLREHCQLPERTAQLYMKIAASGLESATVADIGLNAAAQTLYTIVDPSYNPFHHCDDAGERDWRLFILFLAAEYRLYVEDAAQHCEWLLQKQFKTPDEWLGDEGASFRKSYGGREPSELLKREWAEFKDKHRSLDIAAIDSAVLAQKQVEPPRVAAKRRSVLRRRG